MASIKELRWGIAFVIAATIGCSSGSPQQSGSCPQAGQIACPFNGQQMCTNPATDSSNCGACGVKCDAGKSCVNAACVTSSTGQCPSGQSACTINGTLMCTNTSVDASNCGACGTVCSGGKTCNNGSCSCQSGWDTCGGSTCNNLSNDANNCGTCGTKCTGTNNLCSNKSCVSSCPSGQEKCGSSCVVLKDDKNNCGSCGKTCQGQETCNNGTCVAPTGTGGSSTGGSSSTAQGGSSSQGGSSTSTSQGGTSNTSKGGSSAGGASSVGGTTSQGGASSQGGSTAKGGAATGGTTVANVGGAATGGTTVVSTGPCADTAATGMISDFEEGAATTPPVVKDRDGRKGEWERFAENVKADGTGSPNFKMAVESSGVTADCNKSALHVSGTTSDWGTYVGVGISLAGTPRTNPNIYDASKYTGVRFKAKKGSGHDSKSAVRFNISIPETEGTGSPGDNDACVAKAAEAPTKAARDCYQHMGRFLHVASGYDSEYELGSDWKTYNFCFDRDLYPLSLPSILTEEQRNALPKRILKMQWQFNQGKDWYGSSYPAEGKFTELAKTLPFDFWIDDVEFFTGDCASSSTFKSADGSKLAFPQNTPVSSSCTPPSSAKNFAHAITRAYAFWTKNFVRDNKVIAPEQENGVTTSESMGYGMLISAAMGDKTAFDKFWGYVKTQLSNGLMTWKSGGSGSATDGDVDIAYALLMADAQWGGTYKADATTMINAIKSGDVSGDKLKPGNGWDAAFNPSYFAPSYFKTFGGMDSVITAGYSRTKTNTGSNFPTDWTDWSGGAVDSPGQVTAGFSKPAYGYDAARVPWRVGLGGCAGDADGKAIAKTIVDFFAGKYDSGASIDLMKAGWIKSSGGPAVSGDGAGAPARDFQGSFIGPLGVGAMASGNTVVRDRAFRTILDIMENGDFNHTYFPSTVGFITLLIMSGNFPTP